MPKLNKKNDDKTKSTKKSYDKPQANVLPDAGIIADGDMNEIFDGIDFESINREFEEKHKPKPPILKAVPARILGACVLLVLVVGIVLSVFGVKTQIAANEVANAQRQAIADYISPVVSIGFQPYEQLSDVDMVSLLRCCALYAVENNKSELKQNETGRTQLPVYMLKTALYNLFGDEIELKYYSFDIEGSLFEYDDVNKYYLFSASGLSSVYIPEIMSYSKSSDIITSRVKYVANNDKINAYNDMEYIYKIKQSNGEKRIVSITKG